MQTTQHSNVRDCARRRIRLLEQKLQEREVVAAGEPELKGATAPRPETLVTFFALDQLRRLFRSCLYKRWNDPKGTCRGSPVQPSELWNGTNLRSAEGAHSTRL